MLTQASVGSMTAFQHVVAMQRMDWVSRHDYWERLYRRRSYMFLHRIADYFGSDQLLYAHDLPIHTGSIIALHDVDRFRQLTLTEAFGDRNVRRRVD